MQLILDNNILFSLMNPSSIASYLFSSINAEFFAPRFIKSEFEKHKKECLIKSKLSKHEFDIRQKEVENLIKFFKSSEYVDFLERSKGLISDPDDIDFIALAMLTNSAIWSNDKELKKQSSVKVFNTSELIEKLFSE